MSITKDKKTFQGAVCDLMAACGRDGCVEGWISLDTGEIVTRAGLEKCYELGINVEDGETLDEYTNVMTAKFYYDGCVSLAQALDMLAHWDDDLIPDDDDSI
jgi:hypothetical protein